MTYKIEIPIVQPCRSNVLSKCHRFLSRDVGFLVAAKDGKEDLEAYREHHPDIIITEIMMPQQNGLEMVRDLRNAGGRLPIIVFTAFEATGYLKRYMNLGVDTYLMKPVNGLQLYETLLDLAHKLLIEKTIQRANSTDALTGLINMYALISRFAAEKGRVARKGDSFALIMVDVDHLQKINDKLGRMAGDRILVAVANTMHSLSREEFLMILPDTDTNGANVLAERVRVAVSKLAIEWGRGNHSGYHKHGHQQIQTRHDFGTMHSIC